MATATKPKETKKTDEANKELDEQIEVFEPTPIAVDRVLKHPISGEEKKYVQHEMGFLTKLKFFRLLSGTLRISAESEEGGLSEVIEEIFIAIQSDADMTVSNSMVASVLRLVETAPDFIEETYMYALSVPI